MAKELIISANVHEKKVAMLEDGVVTEFYVERRDENQGVVGNLYKGRVMKVLPGMQSAFVDIGLERDAFLYVSDFTEFMEEAEEIDFREVGDEHRGAHRLDDRSRRGDRPRPEHLSAVTRPAPAMEPPRPEESPAERPVRIEDAVEQLAEIADESLIPPPPPEEELVEQGLESTAIPAIETVSIERITDEGLAETVSAPQVETASEESEASEEKPKRGRGRKAAESRKKTAKTDDKAAKGTRKTSKTGAKRSSRRGADDEATVAESSPSFQRVTDEDIRPDAGELLKDAIVQEKSSNRCTTPSSKLAFFNLSPSQNGESAVYVLSQRESQVFSESSMKAPKLQLDSSIHSQVVKPDPKKRPSISQLSRRLHRSDICRMWFEGYMAAFNQTRLMRLH